MKGGIKLNWPIICGTKSGPPLYQCFGEIKNGVFLRTGAYFFFILNRWVDSIPRWLQRKSLLHGAITEMHCSIMAEMPTKSSKMHQESILVNSAVRHYCGQIRESVLTVPQRDGSS